MSKFIFTLTETVGGVTSEEQQRIYEGKTVDEAKDKFCEWQAARLDSLLVAARARGVTVVAMEVDCHPTPLQWLM